MLVLNMRKRWITWPEAGVRLQLSPLTSSRRSELIEEATVAKVDPKNEKKKLQPRLDHKIYEQLVVNECVHGWDGMAQLLSDDDSEKPQPLPYSKEAAYAAMGVDHFNVFVFNKIQTMGLEMAKDEKAAGNGSGAAPTG